MLNKLNRKYFVCMPSCNYFRHAAKAAAQHNMACLWHASFLSMLLLLAAHKKCVTKRPFIIDFDTPHFLDPSVSQGTSQLEVPAVQARGRSQLGTWTPISCCKSMGNWY